MKLRLTMVALLAMAAVAVTAAPAGARTVWLCQPGQRPDPCTPGLSTTIYSPALAPLRVTHPVAVRSPRIDCFYVYPTVSDQKGPYANLHVDPEERSAALYQAARYSQLCRVYAPMYHQVTAAALDSGFEETPAHLRRPLADVEAAFQDYLSHDNHGRGFVLIGHSQGSSLLEELIAQEIDNRPVVRSRLLSAILPGGNVLVKLHSGVGGTFKHIPACRTAIQLGCVVAFSTFDQVPPADSYFGRTTARGDEVLCVNPATLIGAKTLDPIFPAAPFAPGTLLAFGFALLHIPLPHPSTVWGSLPGAYSARCADAAGADVLEISPLDGAPVPTPSPDPRWGLHLVDANVELGNLLTLVDRQAAAFTQLTLATHP